MICLVLPKKMQADERSQGVATLTYVQNEESSRNDHLSFPLLSSLLHTDVVKMPPYTAVIRIGGLL